MGLSDEQKQRIKNAIQSFTDKNKPQVGPPVRTNAKPEKDVEREVMPWLRANGFSVNVVESKATFDPRSGRYIGQAVKQGFVDIVGNYKTGLGVFIELKAPGRRSTLRKNQRDFLISKIETGCFSVCIDSVELLKNQFERFMLYHTRGQYQLAKDFLVAALPTEKAIKDDGPLFED